MPSLMLKQTRTKYGFTLFEFIIVVIIISTLSVIALNRMWAWRIEAERAMIKTVQGNIVFRV